MAARRPPIQLRLDPRVPFEARLRSLYEALPRTRRQEWLRIVLRLGLDAFDKGAIPASLAVAESLEAQPTEKPVTNRAAASQPAPQAAPASPPRSKEPRPLKGFFGETEQNA